MGRQFKYLPIWIYWRQSTGFLFIYLFHLFTSSLFCSHCLSVFSPFHSFKICLFPNRCADYLCNIFVYSLLLRIFFILFCIRNRKYPCAESPPNNRTEHWDTSVNRFAVSGLLFYACVLQLHTMLRRARC